MLRLNIFSKGKKVRFRNRNGWLKHYRSTTNTIKFSGLKLLHGPLIPSRLYYSSPVKRFKTEFNMLNEIDFVRIPEVYYPTSNEPSTNSPFMIMEFIEGTNLVDYFMRTRFSEELYSTSHNTPVSQSARAIALLHKKGIAKIDTKPENVIINDDIVLLDFEHSRRECDVKCFAWDLMLFTNWSSHYFLTRRKSYESFARIFLESYERAGGLSEAVQLIGSNDFQRMNALNPFFRTLEKVINE